MQNINEYIQSINNEFESLVGGSYVKIDTGEIFTETEVKKYAQRKIEKYVSDNLQDIKKETYKNFEVMPEQNLYNKRSPKKKSKKTKSKYDGGEFNIVYRNKIKDVLTMKLNTTEKLIYYVLRDFIAYPTNCLLINGEVPTREELEPIIGIKERSIRKALNSLEEKGLLKQVQYGHRKAIYFNPEYYASGKELDIDVLKMFNIVQCDNEKVESYLE